MSRRSFRGHFKSVHWWTEKIAALCNASFKARRSYQKGRKRRGSDEYHEEQRIARENSKVLRIEIRRSQERYWSELCKQVESDPWGLPYKIVTKKLMGRRPIPGIKLPGRLDTIVQHLFPHSQLPIYPPIDPQDITSHPFTLEELQEAERRRPRGKHPGRMVFQTKYCE